MLDRRVHKPKIAAKNSNASNWSTLHENRHTEVPFSQATRTGDIVLRCRDLKKAYDRTLFEKLTFQIERGQRWAILGSNGSGKSTLLKCLLNQTTPDSGEVSLGQNLKIGYFDQLLHQLPTDTTAMEAIRVKGRDLDDKARRDILAAFWISRRGRDETVKHVEWWRAKQTMLAWLAAQEANFLSWTNPPITLTYGLGKRWRPPFGSLMERCCSLPTTGIWSMRLPIMFWCFAMARRAKLLEITMIIATG